METEMELSDGEQTSANAHVSSSHYSTPPAYSRTGLIAAYGMERGQEHEQLPGYIFICNGRTKDDCFRYRVFGIPKGGKLIVESIKPGMKLFLYDFEKRLLYGVYEATIGGKLDIEPEAFDKKYPAQVGFRIVKNCYPLPESTFKSAIYENYKGSKFKQELAPHQVMSLLSLFRSFTAPELDALPHRFASRASAPRELSFEERFIAATKLRNASSVLDPNAEPRIGSLMAHQSAPRTHLLGQSYSRQDDFTTPVRETLRLSNLDQPYFPAESRQPRLLGDPSRSSIQDPQLKYLTILSNIRRYGTAPEPLASENEYYPATSSEKDQFASPYSDNKYYSSTVSRNEHSFASAVDGSVYKSELYTSASQKEGEAGQQRESPAGTYYHSEASTVPNMQAVSGAQSHTDTNPQPAAGVIGYTHQPQSVAGDYSTHSQPRSVEGSTQLYAGTVSYPQQQYYPATGQTTQLYAGGTGYIQQPPETGYFQQHHAATTGYAQQPQAAAAGYALQPQAAAAGYALQPQDAATGYALQPHALATGYAPQPHAQTVEFITQPQSVGYTAQYYAQAGAYTQQAVTQGSIPGAPGTTDWSAASLAYSATGDWNAVNQSYYHHPADTTTTYNQIS